MIKTLKEPASWYWTKEEKIKFEEGLRNYGKDWKQIQSHIGSKKEIRFITEYADLLKIELQ